jgi:hypothetical protein
MFIGGQTILLYDDIAGELIVVKTDSEVYVKVGGYDKLKLECIDQFYFGEIRAHPRSLDS